MTYTMVNSIFEEHDADLGAAEAHGIAAGILCVDIRSQAASWLAELFDDEVSLQIENKAILLELFEQTRKLLNAEEEQFAFDLFLPSDEEDLTEQVEALCSWCQGFLFGVGYAKSTAEWPDECGDIMRDIVEFTKLETEVSGEEDENAYMEIHEYLRSAVLMVRDMLMEKSDEQLVH